MSTQICPRESELLDALARGFVGSELEEHSVACGACSELRLVAGALLDDRTEALHEAPVPAAGGVWWRMRMRHRREAEATARRSLLIGQAMTLGVAITLVVFFFGVEVVDAVQHVAQIMSKPLLLAFATLLLIAPIGGWVAYRLK